MWDTIKSTYFSKTNCLLSYMYAISLFLFPASRQGIDPRYFKGPILYPSLLPSQFWWSSLTRFINAKNLHRSPETGIFSPLFAAKTPNLPFRQIEMWKAEHGVPFLCVLVCLLRLWRALAWWFSSLPRRLTRRQKQGIREMQMKQ